MTSQAVLLLLCAGSGVRMQGQIPDKILEELEGKPVFLHSLEAFDKAGFLEAVICITRDAGQVKRLECQIPDSLRTRYSPVMVQGGAERQDSVMKGLQALNCPDETLVFIHDAARPLVRPSQLRNLLQVAQQTGNATLAHPVVDTLKQLPPNRENLLQNHLTTLDRNALWAVETPQVFRKGEILHAYEKALEKGIQLTDDSAAMEWAGHPCSLVENPYPNPKLTNPSDFDWARFLIRQWSDEGEAE